MVRFLRDAPGQEALGIAHAALSERSGESAAEVQDAVGEMADRLARRLSQRADSALAAQREVAEGYGVRLDSVERDGWVLVCYDGDAFRRVLSLPEASADQRARAALALTGSRCADAGAHPAHLAAWNEWRLDVLARVDPASASSPLGEHVRLRRAEVLAWFAWQRERAGTSGAQPAADAVRELQLERCTYGQVWDASAMSSRQAISIAVQPLPAWTELWVFHRSRRGWRVDVLAASTEPGVGYVEAAGFSPDGRRLLVVREAPVRGRLRRRFQVLRTDTLRPVAQSDRPDALPAFRAWSSPSWVRGAVALRH